MDGERQRRGTTTGIADQMKVVPTAGISIPQYAGNLCVQRVVRRRSLVAIDLEILDDRVDVRTKRCDQPGVRQLGRHHASRQQHDLEDPT